MKQDDFGQSNADITLFEKMLVNRRKLEAQLQQASAPDELVTRLQEQVNQLKQERDILLRAATYFAQKIK